MNINGQLSGVSKGIIVLILVCAAIIAYGAFESENKISDITLLTASRLIPSIFLWILLRYTILRNEAKSIQNYSFVVILASLVVAGKIAADRNLANDRIGLNEVSKEYSKFANEFTSRLSGETEQPRQIDTKPIASGDAGEYERIMKEFLAEMQAQSNLHISKLKDSGFYTLLDPSRILGDKSFSESREIIDSARRYLEENKVAINKLKSAFREKIQTANWVSMSVDKMLAAYDEGNNKSEQQMIRIYNLETSAIDEYEKIIDLLEENKGVWSTSDGPIRFSEPSVLSLYNQHILKLISISNEEQEIAKQNINATSEALQMKN